jgi:prepilin-type N-terminal cleavage/methylation domain-containing protein
MRLRNNRGFSLLEMLIVIAVALIMLGFATIFLLPALQKTHLDIAYDTTLLAIRSYRSLAITQNRRYIIIPTAPGTITVQYWGVGVPVNPAPVTVATYSLPSDIQFAVQAGFPNTSGTVPDGFGTGSVAIGFSSCALVGSPCLIFYPDGSAQDDLGNYNNGVLYLSRAGDIYNSRAITVFGATGRVRGWRLDKQGSNNVWVQQ